ncbi:hypothetical protein D3C72_2297470 [compost metagenome]
MLVNPPKQVVGHTDIGARPTHVGKDVHKAAHACVLMYRALGSSPRVTSGGWAEFGSDPAALACGFPLLVGHDEPHTHDVIPAKAGIHPEGMVEW